MLSTTHRHKHFHKDRVSPFLLVRDKSRALSEDNELEKSPTPLDPPTNQANKKLYHVIGLILKYSE